MWHRYQMQLCASPASVAKWQQLLPVACQERNYCHLLLNNCIARCTQYPALGPRRAAPLYALPLLRQVLVIYVCFRSSLQLLNAITTIVALLPLPRPALASRRVEIISQYWQLLIGTSEAPPAAARHVATGDTWPDAATGCGTCSSRQAGGQTGARKERGAGLIRLQFKFHS